MKSGRVVHSFGIYVGFMRSIIPNRVRVQFHVTGPSPQSVILCCMVSFRPQFGQVLVGVIWMAARRAFVETMSWIVTYHVEIMVAGSALECRFFHILPHAAFGYFLTIRISPDVAPFVYMWCKVSYIRRLYDFLASDVRFGVRMPCLRRIVVGS